MFFPSATNFDLIGILKEENMSTKMCAVGLSINIFEVLCGMIFFFSAKQEKN